MMSYRPRLLYWQAIAARNLIVLQQRGFNKEGMSHLFDSMVAGPTAQIETMYWQPDPSNPLSVTPPLNLPDL